jgi:hypothetical protein
MQSQVTIARIYSETLNHLERHLGRVKEGLDVDGACFFARWLFWSGIPRLLNENSTPPGELGMLKCDGAHFAWKLNELLEACNEYYRTGKPAGLHKSELDSLREKLDKLSSNLELVAGHVSKLSPPVPQVENSALFDQLGAGGGAGVARPPAQPHPCQGVTTQTEKIVTNRINGFENE